jgi:hypothetical protein
MFSKLPISSCPSKNASGQFHSIVKRVSIKGYERIGQGVAKKIPAGWADNSPSIFHALSCLIKLNPTLSLLWAHSSHSLRLPGRATRSAFVVQFHNPKWAGGSFSFLLRAFFPKLFR